MSLKSLKKVQIIFCQTTVILFKKIFIDNCISNSNKYKNCAIEDQTIGNLLESTGNLGSKIWNLVPVHMKDLKAPNTFKNQIKKQIPKDCPCHLCKVYVVQVGFCRSFCDYLLPLVEFSIACFIQFFYPILFYLFLFSFYCSFMYFYFHSCIYSFYKFIYLLIFFLIKKFFFFITITAKRKKSIVYVFMCLCCICVQLLCIYVYFVV